MSAKPVAWTVPRLITDFSRDFSAYETKTYTQPLYAESPEQVRALAIAEAARVVRDLYKGDGSRLNSYDEGWNDGVDATEQAIRALSPAPSVTEEWVQEQVRKALGNAVNYPRHDWCMYQDGFRAALQSLGYEVTP